MACHYNLDIPVSKIINDEKEIHGLKYLRTSMAYHKFPNLTELLQSDLNKKVMNNVISVDYENTDCNCTPKLHNRKGECVCKGACNTTTVIYQVTCTTCEALGNPMYYIGSTQNKMKKRCCEQHAEDVCKLVNDQSHSDTFAIHFAKHFKGQQGISKEDVRKHMSVDILWKGNPITK